MAAGVSPQPGGRVPAGPRAAPSKVRRGREEAPRDTFPQHGSGLSARLARARCRAPATRGSGPSPKFEVLLGAEPGGVSGLRRAREAHGAGS